MEKKADIGLIGLAVMGQNLVLNMADHGYTVAVFNRTAQFPANGLNGLLDNFGAYAYERTDKPGGEFFHPNCTGTGAKLSSDTYCL